ncbi:hypothetical protein F66182_7960 [Fusarium sp. NRRL 66182]|nr:hypothetical protein F66182_7960 [Fusarium sp. NRRL 66182]
MGDFAPEKKDARVTTKENFIHSTPRLRIQTLCGHTEEIAGPRCVSRLSKTATINDRDAHPARDQTKSANSQRRRKYQCLLAVVEMIRVVEHNELDDIIRQIRSARSVDEFLDSAQEATLLLPLNRADMGDRDEHGQQT